MTLANQWLYEGLKEAMDVEIVQLETDRDRDKTKERSDGIRRAVSRCGFARRSVEHVRSCSPDVVYTTPGQSVSGFISYVPLYKQCTEYPLHCSCGGMLGHTLKSDWREPYYMGAKRGPVTLTPSLSPWLKAVSEGKTVIEMGYPQLFD